MKNSYPITKVYTWCIALVFFTMPCFGQNVAINEDGSLPNPKAILDVKSYSKGILIPRMSTNDRLGILAPTGLLVFDSTTMSFWYSIGQDTGTIWKNLVTERGWSLRGNRGESDYFLGTTNNKPLQIRVNNRPAGEIQLSRMNTYWGYEAGVRNSSYTGDTSGYGNTATGYRCLYFNSTGYSNSASGAYSLNLNTIGHSNTASGAHSLQNNWLGNSNSAFGVMALYENNSGTFNTASGIYSMQNNTTGSYNTAIGNHALFSNVGGSYNTAIGSDANVASVVSNATAIGYGAVVNASNKVRIGNPTVTVIEGQVPFTVPSDGRFKFQVKEDVKGLDFILQLRPVTYQFDVKRFETQIGRSDNKEIKQENTEMEAAYKEATGIRRSGFIAQEVEKAAAASGYNFSGIIQPKTAQEHYSLSYEAFVVPLVKAVQELSKEQQRLIAAQKQKIEEQDKKIIALQQQLDEIKKLLLKSK
ncbi:hypothetical protein FAM09_19005 [Niastella caeni]|uniref:Peptidase S74 domain-containing protein n=1 Tax=Niastella caeni TaxID=2569763 RepID=A0A4S8HP64_9BACT|nr:tail fiber domain-containing protein [Niastella caeni]THU37045.1 hypothetical protein FAM09_19005 [Niastella caeni]